MRLRRSALVEVHDQVWQYVSYQALSDYYDYDDLEEVVMAQSIDPSWSLADAKAHFSDVVSRAIEVGPQTVTRRGLRAVVVVSAEEWDRKNTRIGSLAEFFAASPLSGSGLEIERTDDVGRIIEL